MRGFGYRHVGYESDGDGRTVALALGGPTAFEMVAPERHGAGADGLAALRDLVASLRRRAGR